MSKQLSIALCGAAFLGGCGSNFDETTSENDNVSGLTFEDGGDIGRGQQPLLASTTEFGGGEIEYWTENELEVPICYEGDLAQLATQKGWITSILNNTWEAESGLNITFRDCPATHSEKYLRLELDAVSGAPGGASGFGMGETFYNSSVPDAGAILHINPSVTTRATVEFFAVHEIGHALGFHHEFFREDFSPSCEQTSGGGGSPHVVLGQYDPSSVMSYEYDHLAQTPHPCRATLPGGSLSPGDKRGVAELYARTGVQVLGTTGGQLKHSMLRIHDWVGWGDVEGVAGEIGTISKANMAYQKRGAAHLLAVTSTGGMFYTARARSGSWSAFDNVHTRTGFTGQFTNVAVADVNGAAHVFGINIAGADRRLQHAIRNSNNTWTAFGDVEGVAPGADLGTITDVSAAAINGEVHVCLVADGKLWHTVRFTNGSWTGFGDVEAAVGQDKGTITQVDCTAVGGHLHLLTLDASNRLWHTVRRGDTGNWMGFGDVKAEASNPGTITDIGSAQWGGRFFATVVAGNRIKVAMRDGDNSWDFLAAGWNAFEDVNTALGSFTFTSVGTD